MTRWLSRGPWSRFHWREPLAIVFVMGCSAGSPQTDATEPQDRAALAGPALPWERTAAPSSPATPPADVAGEIFGMPVSRGNYSFAKRVAYLYPRPWGAADLPEDQREATVWDNLILHYVAFQRGMTATDDEIEEMANSALQDQKQPFTRRGDPARYRQWVKETLTLDAEHFENQIQFLVQIRKLRDQVLQEQQVTVSDDEMKQEFLNEKHHVGGEMVTFDTKDEAQAFYERHQDPTQWEQMKAAGQSTVRPVNLMTLEAYIDLWSIPKDQMYAFHALPVGAVGPPMPFGTKEWCVYRLLEKRTGDLADFAKEREAYHQQMTMKKKYDGMKRWIEQLKTSANLKVYVR